MAEEKVVHHLEAVGIEADVSGYWLWNYATDFLAAARSFKEPSHRYSPVPCYLVCRSIELSLKAYLHTRGIRRASRKRLSHDLENALAEAEQNDLTAYIDISVEERKALIGANRPYKAKEFEYFESLRTVYDQHEFSLEVLTELAARLVNCIQSPVRATIVR